MPNILTTSSRPLHFSGRSSPTCMQTNKATLATTPALAALLTVADAREVA
jgi:hypothetical protein